MSERERLIELLKQNCHCEDEDCSNCSSNGICFTHREADYLLENGVIVPPVKVGDTIYMIVEKRARITREYFRFIKKTKLTFLNLERVLKDWGKTVFLTKEAAEKALKGGAEQ